MNRARLSIPWALLMAGSVCADTAQAFAVAVILAATAMGWAAACFVGGSGG